MCVAEDQYAPGVANKSQAARNGTRVGAIIFAVHIILLLTNYRIDSNVAITMILTLAAKAVNQTWKSTSQIPAVANQMIEGSHTVINVNA